MRTWHADAIERGSREYRGETKFIKTRVAVRQRALQQEEKCLFQATGRDYAECDQILETFLDPQCICWQPPPKEKCPVVHVTP